MTGNNNDTPPKTAPLAPWGSYERQGQNPYPIFPHEQTAHAAYWERMEAPIKQRARALIAARDAYIPPKEHDKGR